MDIIKYSIGKPVTVTVAVILVVMFGILGLNKLPVQLTPDAWPVDERLRGVSFAKAWLRQDRQERELSCSAAPRYKEGPSL